MERGVRRDYEIRIGKETRWVFEVADCRKFYELASKQRWCATVKRVLQQRQAVLDASFLEFVREVKERFQTL